MLAGGHSIMDADVKYGLSVTGVVHPDHIYGNNQGQPSDMLILTKKFRGWSGVQCQPGKSGTGRCSNQTYCMPERNV